jgi:Fe-S-cluster redox enzyme-like protein
MRNITNTHTGRIITDTDLYLEYLYVGDYGKENNIKADFLGYTKKINKVKNTEVDIKDKLVVTVSTQKGCPMKCNFCDCPKAGFKGNASVYELLSQITSGVALSGITYGKRLNVHFARMGEPTFNLNVIKATSIIGNYINETFDEFHPVISTMCPKNNKQFKTFIKQWVELMNNNNWIGGCGLQFSINTLNENHRNEMFNNMSLSLQEIGDLIKELPMPNGRKYTLNFAVTSKSNLDVELMNKFFDKNKCIVKLTPIHETKEAIDNDYEIVKDFEIYSKFEEPLVKDGWDVIVFVPSQEEDSDRITCGNTLINSQQE